MSIQAVLLPVFVLVALTCGLLIWGGLSRLGAIRAKQTRIKDIALGQPAWPDRVMQITQAFHNQLELPILFYLLVGFALQTHKADLLFVVMSWVFVIFRLAHAYVHTTSNVVPRRFALFIVGFYTLILMWAIFAFRILTAA